jgi:glycosyltransferase involved in cell wall biosynthesis
MKICLTLVVRDESENIERCLNSCKDWIDYWVIIDTGSVDDTPQKILRILDGVPGELHHREWAGRPYTHRNEALRLSEGKCDYAITAFDADEEFQGTLPELTADMCWVDKHYGGVVFRASAFVRPEGAEWVEPVHSYLTHPGRQAHVEGISIISHPHQGSRSKGVSMKEKYLQDAAELEQQPMTPRNRFYLALSYMWGGEDGKALAHFEKRAGDKTFPEEQFMAALYAARCKTRIALSKGEPFPWGDYLEAFSLRPWRLEPMHDLVRYCRDNGMYRLGYYLGRGFLELPYPEKDMLFVQKATYNGGFRGELMECAKHIPERL